MAKGVIIVTDSVLLLLQWPLRLRPCTVRSRSLWKGLFCLCSPPQWIWSEAVKLWLKCRPIKRPNILFSLILNGLKVTRMGLRCPRVHLIFHSGSGRRQHHLNCITAQKPEPYFDWFNNYWDIIPFRKCYVSIISWDHGKKKDGHSYRDDTKNFCCCRLGILVSSAMRRRRSWLLNRMLIGYQWACPG